MHKELGVCLSVLLAPRPGAEGERAVVGSYRASFPQKEEMLERKQGACVDSDIAITRGIQDKA